MRPTRENLLETSCHVFAEHGFHDANVAEICERAEANIAAVNYHFRSKQNLYVEALKRSFAVAEERRPLVLNRDEMPCPEARLRQYVDNQFHRMFCTGICGCASRLISHELSKPTFAHADVFAGLLAPQMASLKMILAELLGPNVGKADVDRCLVSVASLFAFYQFDDMARKELLGRKKKTPSALRDMVEHTTEFALSGIAATRHRIEARAQQDKREKAS